MSHQMSSIIKDQIERFIDLSRYNKNPAKYTKSCRHLRMFITATFDTNSNTSSEKITGFHVAARYAPKDFVNTKERDIFEIVHRCYSANNISSFNWEEQYRLRIQPDDVTLYFERHQLWRFIVLIAADPSLKQKFTKTLLDAEITTIFAKTSSERDALMAIVEPSIHISYDEYAWSNRGVIKI